MISEVAPYELDDEVKPERFQLICPLLTGTDCCQNWKEYGTGVAFHELLQSIKHSMNDIRE